MTSNDSRNHSRSRRLNHLMYMSGQFMKLILFTKVPECHFWVESITFHHHFGVTNRRKKVDINCPEIFVWYRLSTGASQVLSFECKSWKRVAQGQTKNHRMWYCKPFWSRLNCIKSQSRTIILKLLSSSSNYHIKVLSSGNFYWFQTSIISFSLKLHFEPSTPPVVQTSWSRLVEQIHMESDKSSFFLTTSGVIVWHQPKQCTSFFVGNPEKLPYI